MNDGTKQDRKNNKAGGAIAPLRVGAVAVLMAAMSGCATESRRIDLATYAPVIDIKGQGYDTAIYHEDLNDCRMIGMAAQARYDAQRKKEMDEARDAAIVGALAGAVLGHAIGSNNDYHTGRSATTGALYGGAIGGSIGAGNVDYDAHLVKFGPTGLVDRCMADRGYRILSAEGYGGG